MITLEDVKANQAVQRYMMIGNEYIGTIGAIEHSINHAELVSQRSHDILAKLGFPQREAELAAIAGYLHDIGNLINRYGHGMSGALMAFASSWIWAWILTRSLSLWGLSAIMRTMLRAEASTMWRLH